MSEYLSSFLVWEAGKPDVLRLPAFFDVIKGAKVAAN